MYIPCGQCIACRLEKSRQWAIRCVYEAQQHEKNCFITLTYKPEMEPKNHSLVKRDLQLFIKRLRKKFGSKIRFFACGEYGDKNNRPHYHACLFNHDFHDKTLWAMRDNIPLYRSEDLEKIWPNGFCTIGDVTFESAAYVARYCLKKITGGAAKEHYGERQPEFTNMSRRPGIGREWYDKYHKDVYAIDSIITRNNLKMRPPKYYDSLYDRFFPKEMEVIKTKRQAHHNESEMQGYRLRCKKRLLTSKLKKLKRGLENEIDLCNT